LENLRLVLSNHPRKNQASMREAQARFCIQHDAATVSAKARTRPHHAAASRVSKPNEHRRLICILTCLSVSAPLRIPHQSVIYTPPKLQMPFSLPQSYLPHPLTGSSISVELRDPISSAPLVMFAKGREDLRSRIGTGRLRSYLEPVEGCVSIAGSAAVGGRICIRGV
jgi:hypothetical protein